MPDIPTGYPHDDFLDAYTIETLDSYNQNALVPSYNGIPLVDDEIEYEHEFIADDYDQNDEEMGMDLGEYLTGEVPILTQEEFRMVQFIIKKKARELNKRALDLVKRVILEYRIPYGGYSSVDWAQQDFAVGGFSLWIPIGYKVWEEAMIQMKDGPQELKFNPYKQHIIHRDGWTGKIGIWADFLKTIPIVGWIMGNLEKLTSMYDYLAIPVYPNIAFYGTMSIELIEANWSEIVDDLRNVLAGTDFSIPSESTEPEDEKKRHGYFIDPRAQAIQLGRTDKGFLEDE